MARLASKLANGGICGSPYLFVMPEKLLLVDKIEDDEEKVSVLRWHRNYSVVSSRPLGMGLRYQNLSSCPCVSKHTDMHKAYLKL